MWLAKPAFSTRETPQDGIWGTDMGGDCADDGKAASAGAMRGRRPSQHRGHTPPARPCDRMPRGDPAFSRQRRQLMQIAKMITYVALVLTLIGGFLVGVAQAAGDKADHIMVTPDAVQWGDAPPSVPAGAKWAVLEGDPPQAGPFTFRVKVPAGFKMPPHTHPNIEHVTVLSGVFHFGMGKELDETKVKPMPAGSYVIVPTDSPHYFVTKEET